MGGQNLNPFASQFLMLIFMVEKLEDYLCNYIRGQVDVFKMYISAALDVQDQTLRYLEYSLGSHIPSVDIKNCEILTDAKIFCEELKVTRDGRNRYKVFYLTDLGREIARKLKEESYSEELQQSPAIAANAKKENKK
jgi:hypothetical protein